MDQPTAATRPAVPRTVTAQGQARVAAPRPAAPSSGAVQIRGGAWYIRVAERVSKFRQDHPNWTVHSEAVEVSDRHALFRATIMDETGRVISVGHKMVKSTDSEDYVEAAETGAVGRALNFLGYDTASLLAESERENKAAG